MLCVTIHGYSHTPMDLKETLEYQYAVRNGLRNHNQFNNFLPLSHIRNQ